ncbi:hypothetical protein [Paeniglutamicibacter antarcticus]|uniref:DUF222 domain-containing protein n=1 Tax=Paeniglutamicibacter antarcticus TaxID=494023 RepID=A0ABP9TKY1_9MICC
MAEPTNQDIVNALNGVSSPAKEAHNDSIHRVLTGQPSKVEEAHQNAVLKALGHDDQNPIGTGKPGANDWLGTLGVEAAKTQLAEAMLKADPKLTGGIVEMRVEQALIEAYETAAASNPTEFDRLDEAARIIKERATSTTATVREAKPKSATTKPAAKLSTTPKTTRVNGNIQMISEQGKSPWL